MPIGSVNFPIQQNNPYLEGLTGTLQANNQLMQNIYQPRSLAAQIALQQAQAQQEQIKNRYLPTQMQQDVLKNQLANQLSRATLPYAGPKAAAEVQNLQADLPLKRAQATYYQAQSAGVPSEIALRMAQAEQQRTQAAQEVFKMQNPAFMAGGTAAQLAGMANLMKTNPALFGQGQMPGNVPQMNVPQGTLAPRMPMNNAPFGAPGGMSMPGQAPMGQQMPQQDMQQPAQFQNPMMGAAMRSYQAQLERPAVEVEQMKAATALKQQQVAGADYLNSPVDSKRTMIGQARAFGLPQDAAIHALMHGETLEDIAEKNGFTKDHKYWPITILNPTQRTESIVQQRDMGMAELDPLNSFITKATAPYITSFKGYSLNYLKDEVLSKLPKVGADAKTQDERDDKISDFVAATIVAPDFNAVRLKTMGSNQIGVQAMQANGDAALNYFKTNRLGMTDKQWKMANAKVTNLLNVARERAKQAAYLPSNEDLMKEQPEAFSDLGNIQGPAAQQGVNQAIGQVLGGKITIPKFNSANEAQAWLSRLSPAQHAQIEAQMNKK